MELARAYDEEVQMGIHGCMYCTRRYKGAPRLCREEGGGAIESGVVEEAGKFTYL